MADKSPQKKANFCDICQVSCSSPLQLSEHVVGHKHKTNVRRVLPDCLPHMYRLQYFIDRYIEQEPLLGLEYVEEIQNVAGCQYQYKCRLCGFHGNRKQSFVHITGPEHVTEYLDKHHPELSVLISSYPEKQHKGLYLKALQVAAATACEKYGRKTIVEIACDGSTSKSSPDRNGDFYGESLRRVERTGDGCQAGFKGNHEFLDYLQKFQIRSDEDALIVKQIMQNCTQALVRFRHEQARQNQPWGMRPGGAPDDRTNADVGSGRVAPASGAQIDAIKLFFDSIKNMDESEVVYNLQKIAATNPAFRSIHIPSVMKYLQTTGRLKTS